MLFDQRPRAERGILLVPVLPGTVLRSVEVVDQAELSRGDAPRVFPVAAALGGGLALIAGAGIIYDRTATTGGHATATPPAATTSAQAPVQAPPVSAPVVHAPLKPPPRLGGTRAVSAADRAHSAAVALAARLPVRLESTALLVAGATAYAVGGTARDGTPSDGIWQIDLKTKKVTPAGRFVEPLTDAAAATRGGVLYLAGGWTGAKLATGVLRWSPGQADALVTRLPVALRGAHAAFVGKTMYVVAAHGSAYAVDVDAGSVSAVASPPAGAAARSNLAALVAALRAAQ